MHAAMAEHTAVLRQSGRRGDLQRWTPANRLNGFLGAYGLKTVGASNPSRRAPPAGPLTSWVALTALTTELWISPRMRTIAAHHELTNLIAVTAPGQIDAHLFIEDQVRLFLQEPLLQ